MKILLVEDDELVVQELGSALQNQHYAVDVAKDGQEGWELGSAGTYDLVLLDVMLPKMNGIELCQQLRSQGVQTPILLMTAQDTNTDEIIGLDAGADDYVTKPLNFRVLLARIRALLRRGQTELAPLLTWGDLCLDPSTCDVTYRNQLLHLTPKEYGLLELFLRNPQRVYSRSVILDHLWTLEASPGEETVTAHIKGLRQKLKAAGIADPIETVYGIGYRLKPTPQAAASAQHQALPLSSQEAQQQVQAKVSTVWERVQEKLSQRVTAIEEATTVLLKSRLSRQQRLQAQQAAHKLAGSLGMFDLDEGSRLAREIEQLLQQRSLSNPQRRQLTHLIGALRQELQRTTSTLSAESPPSPALLIVSEDLSFAQELAAVAQGKGLDSQILSDLVETRAWVAVHPPEVVFLDLGGESEFNAAQLALLEELKASTPPVPVLVSGPNGILNRVQVARLGGRRFLPKPVSSAQVLETIAQVLQQTRYHTATIAVVDDDPQILLALRHLLQPWGIKLIALDALQFWERLGSIPLDLLILDVEMPQISGLELCQLVRNDPRWTDLPVLFLTAHTDAQTMQQVFAAGADDFVTKPIVGPELVTRILNRLERSSLVRRQTQLDPLTGLANYRCSHQELTRLLDMAHRDRQPLCFSVLHLERLQQINEEHGHGLADQALRQFGYLLRQTFQSEDLVARWGGAEFVIGMYAMTERDGVQRLLDVKNKLSQVSLPLTFKAGVVQYPQDGPDLQSLYHQAFTRLQHQAPASNPIRTRPPSNSP
ncbi:MAG: response regulator [Cyanophyceae cyanobacterium]